MELLTKALRRKLPALYATEAIAAQDKIAVVKFFTPSSNWTWYAVEFDGVDRFFGYVVGFEKEWGYFSLHELSTAKGPLGLGVERDRWFEPTPMRELKDYDKGED